MNANKKPIYKFSLQEEEFATNILSQKKLNLNVFTFSDVYADMQELADFIDKKLNLKFSDTKKAAKVMLAAALYFYCQEDCDLDQIKTLFDEDTRGDIATLRKLGISQFVDGFSPINVAMRAFEAAGITDVSKTREQLVYEMQEIVK